MGREKELAEIDYIKYDEENDVSICLVCGKALCGRRMGNIKRHYLSLHPSYLRKMGYYGDDKTNQEASSSATSAACSAATVKAPVTEAAINRKREHSSGGSSSSTRIAISMSKNDFLTTCVALVTVKNLPLSIFDDEQYFKKLLRPYEEHFKVRVNCQHITHAVMALGSRYKQKISQAMHKKMINLKFDFASSMGQSVLVTNIQYMLDTMQLCTTTIGVTILDDGKGNDAVTSFLCEEIFDCLREFNIDISQVYACVTDNGANVSRTTSVSTPGASATESSSEASEMYNALPTTSSEEESNSDDEFYLEIHGILTAGFSQLTRCFTHTIQLVAQDVLEKIDPQIDDCRQVIEFLRKTHSGNIQVPMLDCATSWLSTYTMLNQLYALKNYIEDIKETILQMDWNFVSAFLCAFKPVADCADKLHCEQYIVGDFYRDLMCCELELDELVLAENVTAKLLVESLKQKKELLLRNEAFLAALYMDPRVNFMKAPFLSDEQKQIAVKHLLKTYNTIRSFTTNDDDKSNILLIPDSMQMDTSEASASPYIKLERKMSLLLEQNNRPDLSMELKLQNLCQVERLPFESNILEYWRSKKYKDPELSKLVDVALALPSTQFSAGRAMKALSLIALHRQRKDLSKATMKNLILINLNKAM